MPTIPDQTAKPNLNWTITDSGIKEARPRKGLCYFIVDGGDDGWSACISEGVAYKTIRTLNPLGASDENEARRICEQHYAYSP